MQRRNSGGFETGRGKNHEIAPNTHWTHEIPPAISPKPFRRSSAVEQLTVNQLVVGSIPTAGAILPFDIKGQHSFTR